MSLSGRQLRKALSLTVRDYFMAVIGAALALLILGVIMVQHTHETPLAYQTAGITAAWIPPTVRRWDTPINDMAKKYNIDANVLAILMTMESGGDAKAVSGVGATGLMQIMPATAADIAKRHLLTPVTKYDITNPRTNIEFGAAYLSWLRDEFGTVQQGPDYIRTVELIAAGYNGGAGTANALEKGEGLRDIQPVAYSRDAFNMWRERVWANSPTYDRWKDRGGNFLLDAAAKSQQ